MPLSSKSKTKLLAGTAATALLLMAGSVLAQSQQKNEERPPNAQGPARGPNVQSPSAGEQGTPKGPGAKSQAPERNTAKQPQAESQQPKKQNGNAQVQEPKKQGGSAQAPEKSTQPGQPNKGAQGPTPQPDKKGMANDANKQPQAGRTQISEQQRTDVHAAVLKERNVNKAANVNFSISIGTRVPRTVRLVALPASVVTLVPAYRRYRYVVVNDEICIVDPVSYEIVEVIRPHGQTALKTGPRAATLVLSQEERDLILERVEHQNDRTLALGSLEVGAAVPRNASIREFPASITQQVPKVQGYKYFTSENRVAIVDKQGAKVELIIEPRR